MKLKPNPGELITWVESYLSLGWSLTFFEPGTKGPSGQAAVGWNTPRELVTTLERAAHRLASRDMNIGVCHQPSGTVSFDVDDEAFTRAIFDRLEIDYDDIISRGMRIKSKANRDKVIFKAPDDFKMVKVQWPKKGSSSLSERITIFELRCGPNQDVLPPSLHPDGHHYTWADGQAPWDFESIPEIPSVLADFWRHFKDFEEDIKAVCPWGPAWERHPAKPKLPLRSVDGIGQDIIGRYNAANPIGDVLAMFGYKKKGKRYMAPSSSTGIAGVVIFDNDKCFSHHGSDLLAGEHAHDAFSVLTEVGHGGCFQDALNDAAQQLGIERGAQTLEEIKIDFQEFMENIKKRTVREAVKEIKQATTEKPAQAVELEFNPIPAHLLELDGVLGQIQQHTLETAPKPHLGAATIGALALVGCVLANKVQTSTGLRTNAQLILVAGTGRGKEHPRKVNKAILDAAGLAETRLGGEEIASGPGLMTAVATRPEALFQLDEFGMMLSAAGGEKAGNWERAILSAMMKLHSGAGSVVIGQERADQKLHKRQDIKYPCATFFGTSTASELVPALKSGQVASGFLNRMIFLLTNGDIVKRSTKHVSTDIPDEIIDWVKAAASYRIGLMGTTPENPIAVGVSEQAHHLFDKFEDELIKLMGKSDLHESFYVRSWEHAAKLCMVRAMSRMTAKQLQDSMPCMASADDAIWAIDLIRFTTGEMMKLIEERAVDNEFEGNMKEILRVIKKAGERGRTEAELGKASRLFSSLQPKIRDEALTALRRNESIVLVPHEPPSGRGQKRKAWTAVEFIEKIVD